MELPDEPSRIDDEGRCISLITEHGPTIQREVERRYPDLPYEIQYYTVEVPRDGQQVVTVSAVHLELHVWETLLYRRNSDDANNGFIEFSFAWIHPHTHARLPFYVQRKSFEAGSGIFLRGKENGPAYATLRALLEAELRPALHPILLTDEYMQDPRLLQKC